MRRRVYEYDFEKYFFILRDTFCHEKKSVRRD